MRKLAVLVEDDPDQIPVTKGVLEDVGFRVHVFETADEASLGLSDVPRPIDLVVLDRRLPRSLGDPDLDEVGDELLDELLGVLSDIPFIVFTGHTHFEHSQFVTQDRGVVNVGRPGETLDRVRPFKKGQILEFGKYVSRISDLIDELSDIEVVGLSPSVGDLQSNRRVLRRVARHFGGFSIRVTELTGGLTGLSVWHCRILDASSNEVASVVVKRSKPGATESAAGLHTVLPARLVASPIAVVSGLCGGSRAQVMQIAGTASTSLMALLSEDERTAATYLGVLADAMAAELSGPTVQKTIAEIAEPLVPWAGLSGRLAEHGIDVPRGTMRASTCLVAEHGDMHPGNVLVADGHPVLIDFDSETVASRSLDATTALLAPLFHPESPVRNGAWPSEAQCADFEADSFMDDCPIPEWVQRARRWVADTSSGDRERWTLALAYVVRQMKFPDVADDPVVMGRAIAFARYLARRLGES